MDEQSSMEQDFGTNVLVSDVLNVWSASKKTKRRHKCNQCDYSTSQKSNLKTHLMKHSGEKPNKCNQCDY